MKAITASRAACAAVAMLVAGSLAACSGGGDQRPVVSGDKAFGEIPPAATAITSGGKVEVALAPGLAPNYIYPNLPAVYNGTVVAPSQLWRPLYWRSKGATATTDDELSIAEPAEYSKDRKSVTIRLKGSYQWSDGKPVVANDLVFSVDLIRAAVKEDPSNWSYYTPGQFPDDLASITATDDHTVTLKLTKAYNPSYFNAFVLGNLIPLPSHSWSKASDGGPLLDFTVPANAKASFNYLNNASQDQKTFASNPLWSIVDGPFKLKSFESATGGFTLVPNEQYGGPQAAHVSEIDYLPFTSPAAVFNQLRAGNLTVALLDSTYIDQLPSLKAAGYNYYGMPKTGQVNSLFLNFDDSTNNFDKMIAQPYLREALQHLIDQQGYIASKGVYNGAAVESYSPVSAGSPFAPSFGSQAPYPYSIDAAKSLLEQHGWKVVPHGQTTCVQPGSAENQCGAGIPAGQKLSFNLFYANSPASIAARNTAFISAAKQVGINIESAAKATNFMYANYDDNFAPQNKDQWAMQDAGPINLGGYPTAGLIWSTKGAYNGGHYSSHEADRLMNQSIFGENPAALSQEATFLGKDLPVLYMPNPSNIVVWKNTLSGPSDAFANITQGFLTPEFWYYAG